MASIVKRIAVPSVRHVAKKLIDFKGPKNARFFSTPARSQFRAFTDNMLRTHTCGELRADHDGQEVTLNGFVDSIRNFGPITFLVLRDRYGKIQLVVEPSAADGSEDLHALVTELRPESSLSVRGVVRKRPEKMRNSKMRTGDVEVCVRGLSILNVSQPLPLKLESTLDEELRLRYRYLDLRREDLHKNLALRSKVCQTTRDFFLSNSFLEIETPTLFKSTPEGAREFLVPTRQPGKFYALTQSPQQYKQLLMAGGLDRYFQIARCYRDESGRADRQPEFTQIDVEMSYITDKSITDLMEQLIVRIWKEGRGIDIPRPFLRMPYREAISRFGIDKPDMRFGMELKDVTSIFESSQHSVLSEASQKGYIYAVNAKGLAGISQGEADTLQDEARRAGASHGVAIIKIAQDGKWKSPLTKHMSSEEIEKLTETLQIENGDLIVMNMVTEKDLESACLPLGRVRLASANLQQRRGTLSLPKDQYNFLWVVDFPLFSKKEEGNSGSEAAADLQSTHHPFTAPHPDDLPLLHTDPTAVRGLHYDCVVNGVELGGGSIRIHDPNLQRFVFENILKIPHEKTDALFSHLLEALTYGCPPHGGIAFGLDRLVLILSSGVEVGISTGMHSAGSASLRDVIAFPKSAQGRELMTGAPSSVDESTLRGEYHLNVVKKD